MTRTFAGPVLTALILCSASGPLRSQTAALPVPANRVARLATAPADVSVTRAGRRLVGVHRGTALRAGDIIRSGDDPVNIRIGTTAIVHLRPHSAVRIAMFQPAISDEDGGATHLKLEEGALVARLKHLTGDARFSVEAQGSVTAAHGTTFMVDASEPDGPTTAVMDGTVGVSLANDPTHEVPVRQYEELSVHHGVLPTRARPARQRYRQLFRQVERHLHLRGYRSTVSGTPRKQRLRVPGAELNGRGPRAAGTRYGRGRADQQRGSGYGAGRRWPGRAGGGMAAPGQRPPYRRRR